MKVEEKITGMLMRDQSMLGKSQIKLKKYQLSISDNNLNRHKTSLLKFQRQRQ